MSIRIIKLDRRYDGHKHFTFAVELIMPILPHEDRIQTFQDMIQWCWGTWGPSCDYDHYPYLKNANEKWAWRASDHHNRILLNSEEVKNWFIMRWR